MAIKTRKLPVGDLDLGMFVSKLDVPWASTPFPLQGFFVENQEDIDRICHFCRFVYIDEVRSHLQVKPVRRAGTHSSSGSRISEVQSGAKKPMAKSGYIGSAGAKLKRGNENYEITKTISQEVKTAKKLYTQLNKSIQEIQSNIDAGKALDPKNIQKVTSKIVESMIRNPDALTWLSKIQSKDIYTFNHTIRCCIWAISFGRYLGLPKDDLENLAMAALLTPIGKTKLPKELLATHLNESDKLEYQKHVQYSVQMIQELPDIPANVIYIVESYCERHNGTGYPLGLKGKRIPFLGRVMGLVDYYDILINPRDPKNAFSSADAISHLFKLRDSLFHGEMVEAFIQAIGVYPTGSLVELSTREVAMIVEQKRGKRLKPKVVVVLDEHKNCLSKHQIIDLQKDLKDKNGNPIRIIGSIPASAYDIDMDTLHKSLYGKLIGWF